MISAMKIGPHVYLSVASGTKSVYSINVYRTPIVIHSVKISSLFAVAVSNGLYHPTMIMNVVETIIYKAI